jgi:prepilin-type N-terminal cleavage/methylation domain-containing protein
MIMRNNGVTLIELIIVITVVGILAAGSASYISGIVDSWTFLSFRSDVVSQSRLALSRMTREMRDIKNSTAVLFATGTYLRFIDSSNATINYTVTSNNLMRNSDVLAAGVSRLAFTYYDKTKTVIPAPIVAPSNTDIYMIGISLNVTSGSESKSVGTRVFPRNLAD